MKPYGVAPILWGLCLNASCGGDSAPAGASDAGTDRSARTPPKVEAGHPGDASDAGGTLPIPASCAGQLQPPNALSCTGLYSDITTGTLARAVRAYAPAVPLWADGSTKERWIYLPPGQKIDTTDPSEWTFPVGTRVWKQFSRGGHRVETRFFEKTLTNY